MSLFSLIFSVFAVALSCYQAGYKAGRDAERPERPAVEGVQ